jgi:hypothetical protein
MPYRYRTDILEQLLVHGVRPTEETSPELVRDFVNDLYRYELRRLRDSLKRGDFPKDSYFHRVYALRLKYPVLALKPWQWVE